MFRDDQPVFPLCCFSMSTGSFEPGYKNFDLQIWFLDKAGVEGEFEVDVVSDQTEIANDIVGLLKKSWVNSWLIDDNIIFEVLLEKYEDYLSGVKIFIRLKTINNYDTCAIPFNT